MTVDDRTFYLGVGAMVLAICVTVPAAMMLLAHNNQATVALMLLFGQGLVIRLARDYGMGMEKLRRKWD